MKGASPQPDIFCFCNRFNFQNFKTINTIIERDSKDTTCGYALSQGTVRKLRDINSVFKKNIVLVLFSEPEIFRIF
jgi:hypothetical protein